MELGTVEWNSGMVEWNGVPHKLIRACVCTNIDSESEQSRKGERKKYIRDVDLKKDRDGKSHRA